MNEHCLGGFHEHDRIRREGVLDGDNEVYLGKRIDNNYCPECGTQLIKSNETDQSLS